MRLLAGLSKFVIADITNPKSAPLELQATVPESWFLSPDHRGRREPFAMLQDLWIKHRDWVFEPIYYSSVDALIARSTRRSSSPPRRGLPNCSRGRPRQCGGSTFRMAGAPGSQRVWSWRPDNRRVGAAPGQWLRTAWTAASHSLWPIRFSR